MTATRCLIRVGDHDLGVVVRYVDAVLACVFGWRENRYRARGAGPNSKTPDRPMVGGCDPPFFEIVNPQNDQPRRTLPPFRKLPRRALTTATIPLTAIAVGGVADAETTPPDDAARLQAIVDSAVASPDTVLPGTARYVSQPEAGHLGRRGGRKHHRTIDTDGGRQQVPGRRYRRVPVVRRMGSDEALTMALLLTSSVRELPKSQAMRHSGRSVNIGRVLCATAPAGVEAECGVDERCRTTSSPTQRSLDRLGRMCLGCTRPSSLWTRSARRSRGRFAR
jgi:hypothetical protein